MLRGYSPEVFFFFFLFISQWGWAPERGRAGFARRESGQPAVGK